ncbi:MAG: ATP-dependent DNA helicase RecG [Candidatus Omnitrophica bacterium]|nr:ATP-dependent DNA helicase RecG [Candidatus Omnitrophota bacterium]MDE2223254.1 ATP-dependent DNA helicase RecG [Candidatus Omnitrophota bacterium]
MSSTPIQFIKGVGPAKAGLLANLGIATVEDLLYLFPYRYEDRSQFTPIAMVQAGVHQTVCGTIISARRNFYSKNRAVEVMVGDKSGRISCVWFNQPYLVNIFKEDQEIVLYGKVDIFSKRLQMVVPDFELISKEDRSLNMGRIVPIYPLTKGISQRYLRKLIDTCLGLHAAELQDIIPQDVRRRHDLNPITQSIRQIHFPPDATHQQKAIDRIAFEEFFLFQICVILRRLSIVNKTGITHKIAPSLIEDFKATLPFTLTGAQTKAIDDIAADMAKTRPMLRMIQGDVGSGKTVAAFFGCIAAWTNRKQAAVMAPTEILAQQHFFNFQKLFAQGAFKRIRTALLISSTPAKEKKVIYQQLKEGEIDLIIGTHALLEETIAFKELSFVVIDEQHKFGVDQRALLTAKGSNPDILIMTATPIPRTLCLTLYGDLDVSVINEMPPGRGLIKTYQFPTAKAQAVYQKVRELVLKGSQAYIIYPLVDESEKLELKAAKDQFLHLQKFEFTGLRLGLVHGQMTRQETDAIMEQFKRQELDILVATTILEVGIDIPNANVMVIEHAERFGLSQLHQLRGRIGRGAQNAMCVLLADPVTEESKLRLEAIVATTDGFKIAEQDLNIRGPGHYFGRHQHGLNELKMSNPITQLEILEKAREDAIILTKRDSQLSAPEHRLIKNTIRKRYPQYLDLILAG